MANASLAKSPAETTILVTGGAGFIGSHTCVELLLKGYRVVVVDNLSNSSAKALDRVRQIVENSPAFQALHAGFPYAEDGDGNCAEPAVCPTPLEFVEADILDRAAMEDIFARFPIDAIIHFAGLKAVGESVRKPLEYYWNNIAGSLVLLDVARKHGCKNLVFSSSATVYGEPDFVPITEMCPKHNPTNPYGQTKTMQEQIFVDFFVGDPEWNIVLLRYFNPIGAHESGLIGEDPKDIPNNLVPYVAQVAVGKRARLSIFGNDYPTPDGTGVRDYIHVVDLARGHVAALEWMAGRVGTPGGGADDPDSRWGAPAADGTRRGVGVFNLGTGRGSSVLDVVRAYERACGHEIPYVFAPRRDGDIAENYAACDKAAAELGWRAEYDLDRMCADSWRWQSSNPDGYEG